MNRITEFACIIPLVIVLIIGQFSVIVNDHPAYAQITNKGPITSFPLPTSPTYSQTSQPSTVQQDNEDQYSFVDKWGSQGTGNGQFNNPTGILIDETGSIYVSDFLNNDVQKFTQDHDFVTKFGIGNGQFLRPFGIDFDSQGNIYVVDQVNQKIQRFSNDGTFLTEWGTGSSNPTDIVIDRNTDTVFVTIQFSDQIRKFTTGGMLIGQWGSTGTGDGQFTFPRGITAVCNSDEVVTGGGYLGGGNQFFITKDKAEDNSWIVGGLNQNTQSQNPVVFTAFAQCAKLGT